MLQIGVQFATVAVAAWAPAIWAEFIRHVMTRVVARLLRPMIWPICWTSCCSRASGCGGWNCARNEPKCGGGVR